MEATQSRSTYRRVLATRLTEDQHAEIAAAAAQVGIPMSTVIRNGALAEARRILHSRHQHTPGLTATYRPELGGMLITAHTQTTEQHTAASL